MTREIQAMPGERERERFRTVSCFPVGNGGRLLYQCDKSFNLKDEIVNLTHNVNFLHEKLL